MRAFLRLGSITALVTYQETLPSCTIHDWSLYSQIVCIHIWSWAEQKYEGFRVRECGRGQMWRRFLYVGSHICTKSMYIHLSLIEMHCWTAVHLITSVGDEIGTYWGVSPDQRICLYTEQGPRGTMRFEEVSTASLLRDLGHEHLWSEMFGAVPTRYL